MASYADRLDRLEAAIAPGGGSPHLVFVNCGQTRDQAVAAYAQARGLTNAAVSANMIVVTWASAADGRPLTSGGPT